MVVQAFLLIAVHFSWVSPLSDELLRMNNHDLSICLFIYLKSWEPSPSLATNCRSSTTSSTAHAQILPFLAGIPETMDHWGTYKLDGSSSQSPVRFRLRWGISPWHGHLGDFGRQGLKFLPFWLRELVLGNQWLVTPPGLAWIKSCTVWKKLCHPRTLVGFLQGFTVRLLNLKCMGWITRNELVCSMK